MPDPHLPDALYASLPYTYAAAGAATIAWLPGGLALLSGTLLISAALAVATMRFRHRRALERDLIHAAFSDTVPAANRPGENPRTALVQLVWRREYECGLPVIDGQHRRLVEQGSDLLNAVLRRDPLPAVEARLDDLVAHVRAHFRVETEVLARSSHPITPEHEADHHALLARAEALQRRFARGQVDVSELVGFVADDLFTQHITREDLQLSAQDLARERAACGSASADTVPG